MTKRNGAFAGRYCLHLLVSLLIVNPCSCGLSGLSLLTALSGCPFFGNHSTIGTWGIVNHFAGELLCLSLTFALACNQCTIPFCRKREALNRKGGQKLSGQAMTRESRVAKWNLRLARAGSGGDVALPFHPAHARKQPLNHTPQFPAKKFNFALKNLVFLRG